MWPPSRGSVAESRRSQLSTKRRTDGVFATPTPRNAKGERLCRNCKVEGRETIMPKGKRHNCSSECSDAWAIKTSPALVRRVVFLRDEGRCAVCHVDTEAQHSAYRKLHTRLEREEFLKMAGVTAGRAHSGDWWDADHIVPVVEGGGECGLSNYRTLCIPCHKAATKALRGRIASKEKTKRAIENDRSGLFADQLEGM
jgi:5-methylcytosine-specific restriction protein A